MMEESRQVSLFLFAHQDDEFGVFQQIEKNVRSGKTVYCVYATDGSSTAEPALRDRESINVLVKLGVPVSNVLFPGHQHGIRDGRLDENVELFRDWLETFLDLNPEISDCFVPAWEGGHPDHDLLHAITLHVMQSRCGLARIRQFSLYHGRGCPPPFFKVLSPLPENGPVEKHRINWKDRFRYMRFCLSYSSQWRTWVGLFPFVLFNYVVCGSQCLQRVSLGRLEEKPHQSCLYYEGRAMHSWLRIKSILNVFSARVDRISS